MERAILARHGESEYSVRGLCNGDPAVGVALTERGRRDAWELGERLADEPIDLCITSAFPRVQETATIALAGRDVPRLVVADLNDPLVGPFEGETIDEYRRWAAAGDSTATPGGGGESRLELVTRYLRGYRAVLDRPEETVLVVFHSLPLAYVLEAYVRRAPGLTMPIVAYATPFAFTWDELDRAVGVLDAWAANPTW